MGIALTGTAAAIVALVIIGGMLILFVTETYPPEVVSVAGAAVMVVLGIVSADQLVSSFANPAPWTIAGMFILVGALVRAGGLDILGRFAAEMAARRPRITFVVMSVVTIGLSAFLNNTPLVVVMMPVYVQLAKSLDVAPSKVLIPLSYSAILGGTLTMIGTSTNLVVDGVWSAAGMGHFGLFEVTPIGALMALVGAIYLGLFANRLLPDRRPTGAIKQLDREFLSEVFIDESSPLIGKGLHEIDVFKRPAITVIDVIRGPDSMRWNLGGVRLEAHDRVVVRSSMPEALGLREHRDLRSRERITRAEINAVEVVVAPGSRLVGRTMGSLHLRRRFGVYVVAVHRRNHDHQAGTLRDLTVEVGDLWILAGAPGDIEKMVESMELTDVQEPSERPFRRRHAPIVLACLVGVVVLAAFEVMPIMSLVAIAVAVVLVTRCIDISEAVSAVDGKLIVLLLGMLVVGSGLNSSGGLQLIVDAIAPLLQNAPAWVIVAAVYLLSTTLTEVVTNNAVALILTPLAIVLGTQLGVDPKPLVIAVMMGASASFITPIGYQTNTIVYGPGGYRFTDFARAGLPLTVLLTMVAAVAIPLLWPLRG